MTQFQESLMDFAFQMGLDSLFSIVYCLNGPTNNTNLQLQMGYFLLFLGICHIWAHEFDLFSSLSEFLHFFETPERVIDFALLTVFLWIFDKFLNICFNGQDSIEDLFGSVGWEIAFVIDDWLVLFGFFLNFLKPSLNPV
jgi:hypothetical protein